MKQISLAMQLKLKEVLLSPEDEYLRPALTCIDSQGYVRMGRTRIHSYIMKTPSGYDTDHINRIRTDNRRLNLRLVSRSENIHNSKLHKHNQSGCKGVHFSFRERKWIAQGMVAGRHTCLYRGIDFFLACCARKAFEARNYG